MFAFFPVTEVSPTNPICSVSEMVRLQSCSSFNVADIEYGSDHSWLVILKSRHTCEIAHYLVPGDAGAVSMWMLFGLYGNQKLEMGILYSRVIKVNSFFVKQIQVGFIVLVELCLHFQAVVIVTCENLDSDHSREFFSAHICRYRSDCADDNFWTEPGTKCQEKWPSCVFIFDEAWAGFSSVRQTRNERYCRWSKVAEGNFILCPVDQMRYSVVLVFVSDASK